MALDQATTAKLGDWFNTNSTPAEPDASTGSGMLSAPYNTGSGVFGVQTATTGNSTNTSPTMLNLGDLDRRTVSQPTETVSGQLDSLIKADSPYIQTARQGAMRTANSRGLLNSSMAAGAGEEAAIKQALPIATSDAATYGKAADYNTSLVNQGRLQNAEIANQFAGKNLDIQANTESQQRTIDANKATQQADILAGRETQQADIASKMSLTERQAQLQAEAAQKDVEAKMASQVADQNAKMLVTQVQAQIEREKLGFSKSESDAKNKLQLVNNVLINNDLSPDRKAELLISLGEPSLARAVYVMKDTELDLTTPELSSYANPSRPPTSSTTPPVGNDDRMTIMPVDQNAPRPGPNDPLKAPTSIQEETLRNPMQQNTSTAVRDQIAYDRMLEQLRKEDAARRAEQEILRNASI